jgi:hypothetical protein
MDNDKRLPDPNESPCHYRRALEAVTQKDVDANVFSGLLM